MQNKNQKRNTGITLIALVVTIIVLIILAGVSINMLVGKNGIITQAERAKDSNSKANIKEKITMAMQGLIVEKYTENNKIIEAGELEQQLYSEGLIDVTVSGNINLIVTVQDNNSYIVKQNGEVMENNIALVLQQGDYVDYNSESLSGGENWRVFYVDGNTVNIVSNLPTEIVQATNNDVTEESAEKAKEFEEFLGQKRTESVTVKIGRDASQYDDDIVEKNLNYFSSELAKNYALTITMEDIKKAVGISYTIGEPVSYEELKRNDLNNLFPLSEDCYLIATYYGDFNANKNSLYMMASNTGGLFGCWLLESAFPVGTKIRPIVQLKENLQIISGNGTKDSPYVLSQNNS